MTFLNFSLLFGLFAGLIPILIHLLNKQKLQIVDFSNVEFLKILQKQKMRKVKLKQWLLLLIRTLAILSMVFAFARPTIEGYFGTGIESHAKTSVIIVLDNSLSSATKFQGEKALSKIKNKTKEIISFLKKGDDIQIVLPNKNPEILPKIPTRNFTNLSTEVDLLNASDVEGNLSEAILTASELLANSSNLNKEIYVISDLQKNAFGEKLKLGEQTKLYFLPVKSATENVSVSDVNLDSQILTKGKKVKVSAKVNNFSPNLLADFFVQIFINGKRVGHQTLNVAENSSSSVEFIFNLEESGIHEGYIEIPDDALLEDNKVFFSFEVPDKARVLAVTNTKELEPDFLEILLKASENQAGILPKVISSDLINSENFADYNTVILSNVPEISVSVQSKLKSFVENGGGLVVFLGDRVDIKNYNNGLVKELKLPEILNPLGNAGQFESYLTLREISFEHPIFEGVFDRKKPTIDSPKFYYAYRLKSKVENDQIMKFSNSDTFLEEISRGKGKVLFFASALNLLWTDLPVKGIFPPLLSRSVSYLSFYKGSEKIAYLTSDSELQFIGTTKEEQINSSVLTPSEKIVRINPQLRGSELKLTFDQVSEKGFYKFLVNEKPLKSFAVNFPPTESNLEFLSQSDLENLIDGEFLWVVEDASLEDSILQSRFGFELWKYFLILTLLLLVAETLIGRNRKMEVVQA